MKLTDNILQPMRWAGSASFMLKLAVLTLAMLIPGRLAAAGESGSIVLQLKWMHQFQFAGYYAAVEKGYYREAGLDVILKEARPGLDITAELVSGRADFLVNNPSALLARAAGKPIVALAAIFQHSPLVMVTRKDAGIMAPSDLSGRKVMLIPETESELVAMFIHEGLTLQHLEIVPHSWNVDDLVSRRVVAMSAYLTDAPFLLQQRGIDTGVIRPLTYGIDFYGDILFTTAEQISRHPERTAAFRAASLKGWAYAMDNPEEIVDLILKKYSTRLSREALLYEAAAMQELILPHLIEPGHMNPGRWRHIAATYKSLGMLPESFELTGFLYDPDGEEFWSRDLVMALLLVLAASGISLLILLQFNSSLRSAVQKKTRELRRSEASLRQLADSMPQLVWAADAEGMVDYYNERYREFSGFRRNEDGSWEWTPVLHPDDAEKTVDAWISAHESGRTYEIEHRVQRTDGTYAWYLSRAQPIRDEGGNIVRWYGTTTDIDALKRTEMDLEEAKKTAEDANRVKSEFLANMSHEIRTPMTVIMSTIEHLLEVEKDPEKRNFLDLADLSSKRLHVLVEEILDFAKIEARRLVLDLERFDIRRCLADSLRMLQSKAEERNLDLDMEVSADVPEEIVGDEYRIGQILLNLISNGLKFTEEGGVRVMLDRKGDWLEFRVRDSGVGIPADKQESIFEVFNQVDNTSTRKYGGAGLGLAICKGLVELMGGEIRVESQPGRGSLFIFTLPLNP